MPVRAGKESSTQLYRTWRYVASFPGLPHGQGTKLGQHWFPGPKSSPTLSPPHLPLHILIPSHFNLHTCLFTSSYPHTLTFTPASSHPPHPHRLARASCPTSFPRTPWCSHLLDARPKFWSPSTSWGKQRSVIPRIDSKQKKRTNDGLWRDWTSVVVISFSCLSLVHLLKENPLFTYWYGIEGCKVMKVKFFSRKKKGKKKNIRPMWGSNPRPWD